MIVLVSGCASRFTPDEVAADLTGMVKPGLLDAEAAMVARLRRALQTAGADSAVAAFTATGGREDMAPRRIERGFNRLACELIHFGRYGDAATVVRTGITAVPDSWILHDTLGEAYLGLGARDSAITRYRRSLELNPDHHAARAVLDSLGSTEPAGQS